MQFVPSYFQLLQVIQFLKLLNPIVRGQFSSGQTLHQVFALGRKRYFSRLGDDGQLRGVADARRFDTQQSVPPRLLKKGSNNSNGGLGNDAARSRAPTFISEKGF